MPKYYCAYCDVYLTHDSPNVRRAHNRGWKHKTAVRCYYAMFEHTLLEKKQEEEKTVQQITKQGSEKIATKLNVKGPLIMSRGVILPNEQQTVVKKGEKLELEKKTSVMSKFTVIKKAEEEPKNISTNFIEFMIKDNPLNLPINKGSKVLFDFD
ncbi:u1 small nuclear ribonucleoprotein c [Anaeramoeba flamelloides]|uniref:U1 small nuclear ribonucleoprotein c n=1 Tax=Anaeramoeba flamelloides TaxID=1746091 RepID=A0AAV7YVV0_9EUKA|nr:u1 small nuclear ribonucleoprotein c [Anaeramoeba flamelloides]KAJ6246937.1 u1 small nuclear ribonucleoprotein c [Anaeramoeba flamelloides]